MRREISSTFQTVFSQTIVVGLVVVIFFLLVLNFNNLSDSWFISLNYFFIFFSVVFFIIRWLFRLKKIEMTDKGLFISDLIFSGKKEFYVPFEEVCFVSQNLFLTGNFSIIGIELLENSKLGKKIWFMPDVDSNYSVYVEHPIVGELNHRIRQCQLS